MNNFTIENQNMAYLDEGQGPVLVFGHSYLWDSAMWQPQVEALKSKYRCIVPELWSHGQSDAAPSSMRTLKIMLNMFWHCWIIWVLRNSQLLAYR